MRRLSEVLGLVLSGLVVCLAGVPAATARDVTDVAGVPGYRQQLSRILKARIASLRHSSPGGIVDLRFTVDRDGHVIRSEVAATSGSEFTDRLALGIVPVGLKLPPLPPRAPIAELTVTVPVRLSSREAAMSDALRTYRAAVTQALLQRVRNLPHQMLTGGMLHIRFTIGRDGVVTRSDIARSSGDRAIDELGLRIVPVGLRLPPLPPGQPTALSLTQPLAFGLAPEGR
ncbi:TonB family C-terminal domain-containing protein [Methylorubrum salsuginis]|uniref:TonB family C-terminal domain-containing protein n=1 Tax=Methylorubrum salsuginis TaxID=414703 RepID=A0A1I4BPS9_9HYPH|nr:TonB family C-terminal domain-containing protein [Methylorubrum salsuginis]